LAFSCSADAVGGARGADATVFLDGKSNYEAILAAVAAARHQAIDD